MHVPFLHFRLTVVALCLFVGGWGMGRPAQAQQVPEEIRQELERQDMTPEEARRRAEQLGIDLSDPEAAARQARQRGIPEARVQALLEAARQAETGGQPRAGQQPTPVPMLAGRVTIRPDSLTREELPRDVTVQIPLTSDEPIQSVEPFFVRRGGGAPSSDTLESRRTRASLDTLRVRNLRQGPAEEGETLWRGRRSFPSELKRGTYPLRIRVTTAMDTTVLFPNRAVIIGKGEPEPEEEERDTLQYFGYNTFDRIPDAFRPSPSGPVDDSYVVGPGDELRLVVWGAPEFQYDLTVDRQGRVYVPNHGQFTAGGRELADLRQEMKQWLSRRHSGLTEEPQTVFMDLSVARIQPIKIFVLGEVDQPGGYTVSAMSNAFNALYSVGGPKERGSLRGIQVIRNGETVSQVDLYDYLVESKNPDPIGLQTGDYLRVPTRGRTVAITGAVKRPAYYEMIEGETVRDLIEYAGGLRSEAYASTFRVSRLLPPREREGENPSVPRKDLTFDLNAVMAGDATVELRDADRVHIRTIPGRTDPASESNVESAHISGAVFQPGTYTIGDGVRTVQDLIEQANGLTDDAYRKQASLIRFDESLGEAVKTVNVDSAMAGVPQADLPLVAGDSLHVPSVHELEGQRTVRISGQVRDPGTYPYRTDMTVADLLLRGGGLADSTYLKSVLRSRADLFRQTPDGRSERVIPFNLARALNGDGMADRSLRPGDEIRIYPLRTEVNQNKFVEVSGAVKAPGQFRYQENLTLKDVILRANGFEEGAYLRSIEVARPDDETRKSMDTLRVPLTGVESERVRYTAEDTTRALQAAADFQLQHRDRVIVREDPDYSDRVFVTVRGEVQFPGEYGLLDEGERLSSVLERAGGVTPNGYPGGGQLVRDGEQFIIDIGAVVEGEQDLQLMDGDRIVIPTQPNSVAVRGNVAQEGRIKHQEGRRVEYYLDRAGGVRDSTKNVYLTQASGATFKVGTGWFSRTPVVEDGAVIRVTREASRSRDQEGVDVGQVITDVTGILSSALTIIVLASRAFGN